MKKVVVEVLRKMQEQAEESYHNCYAECCGKYTNKGCCGDYVQTWSERDRVVMETLGEHINKLSELANKLYKDNQ